MPISAISQKALKTVTIRLQQHRICRILGIFSNCGVNCQCNFNFIEYFPFTLKIYENNYYAKDMKSRSLS